MAFKTIDLSDYDVNAIQIFVGNQDAHLQVLHKAFKTDFILRDQQLKFDSEQFDEIQQVVSTCFDLIESKHKLNEQDVNYLCRLAKHHQLDRFDLSHLQPIAKTRSGKLIYPKTLGQAILLMRFSITILFLLPVWPVPVKPILRSAMQSCSSRKKKWKRLF